MSLMIEMSLLLSSADCHSRLFSRCLGSTKQFYSNLAVVFFRSVVCLWTRQFSDNCRRLFFLSKNKKQKKSRIRLLLPPNKKRERRGKEWIERVRPGLLLAFVQQKEKRIFFLLTEIVNVEKNSSVWFSVDVFVCVCAPRWQSNLFCPLF